MGTVKELARRTAPATFVTLRGWKNRALIEWRVLRHLRPRDLARRVWPRRDLWKSELPVQRPRRLRGAEVTLGDIERRAPAVRSGGHAVYLSPAAWEASPLAALRTWYPDDAGIKIVRQVGTVATGVYWSGTGHSQLQCALLHGHPQLSLVAAVLHLEGLGPRLFDLLELELGSGCHVAYVSRHVAGQPPTTSEWQRGIAALRALGERDVLGVAAPDGFCHDDFRAPDCAGNAFVDPRAGFQYVDFQNFLLGDYARYLRRLTQSGVGASHFGDRSLLRGGSYLYHEVPGVDLPAKRSTSARLTVLRDLLSAAQCELGDRVVLDVGCNIGMMIAEYLRLGAAWCHGWDMPEVATHAEKLLLAIGCSRFSLTGNRLARERDLWLDVPELVRRREQVVLSYLAVRRHLGWLDALTTLPWSHLIYEGHEGEDEEATRRYLAELAERVPCRVTALASYRDGDSDRRFVAIAARV